MPPLATSVEVYAVPTVPEGGMPLIIREPVVTVVIKTVFCTVTVFGTSLWSVTENTTVKLPSLYGVPEIVPVEALNDSPSGSEPPVILNVSAPVPPLAVTVALYACPTVPVGSVPLIVGAGLSVIVATFVLDVPAICAVSCTCICADNVAGAL